MLWALNGFVQGMGWPPCGRVMGHWFSESERGLTFSIWNTSHNVGGGIAGWLAAWAVDDFGGWQYAFYVPGAIAAIGAVYLFWRLRDTPQSVGLPPIEEYRNDYPAAHDAEPRPRARAVVQRAVRRQGAAQQIRVAAGDREFLRVHHALQHARLGPDVSCAK